MTETAASVPAPLLTMRSIAGTLEAPGAEDNPVILSWANAIAQRFPKMLSYCAQYKHDSIAWCGLTDAYCMAVNGIEPPFGPEDTDKFLYVDSWEKFGTPIDKDDAQPGDVMIFRGGGMHHVTMLDHVDGDHFVCLGGNQSDAVKLSSYPKSACTGVRRAPAPSAVPATPSLVISKANNFDECLAVVLKWEGGNDDDPRDPGGRTSRGILQKEWNVYLRSHPGLPSDVWKAPQADIVNIYHQSYWNVIWGDKLPRGVDMAMFDFAVLEGVGKVKELQAIVGSDQDGEMGPNTLAATLAYINANGAAKLINLICDRRLELLSGSKNWVTYGRGWTSRVADVRAQALAMAAAPATQPAEPEKEEPMTDTPAAVPANEVAQAGRPAVVPPSENQLRAVSQLIARLSDELPSILAKAQAIDATFRQLQASGAIDQVKQLGTTLGLPKLPEVPAATVTPADVKNKTGLGAGILGVIGSIVLGLSGVIGMPVGEHATTTGAVLPMLSAGVGLLGGFGKLAPLLRAALAVL